MAKDIFDSNQWSAVAPTEDGWYPVAYQQVANTPIKYGCSHSESPGFHALKQPGAQMELVRWGPRIQFPVLEDNMNNAIPEEDYDPAYEEQKDLREHVIDIEDPDDEWTLTDPRTGRRYMECIACSMIMTIEDHHSGMECNLCHAMGKDD